MIEVKLFEIRDRATFISALAVRFVGNDDYLLRRAGFGQTLPYAMLTHIESQRTEYDAFKWGNRTMQAAHHHIISDWPALTSGQVVDVEYILGESS